MDQKRITRYQMKAVIFDLQKECCRLKKELLDAKIAVLTPFWGLKAEQTLQTMFSGTMLVPEQCLLISNNRQHAELATACGMAVAGCMEGHFEVPKSSTLLENPSEVSVGYLNQIYCHEKKIPATIAETKRCFIREMCTEDMETLYEILTEEETARYLQKKEGSREEEMEKLKSYVSFVYSFFDYGYWGVFSKKTGELIGRAGFKEGDYPLRAGYVLRRSEWGKGLATEILTELVHYAEEELGCTEIYADIDVRNKASLRVAEKCGLISVLLPENSISFC